MFLNSSMNNILIVNTSIFIAVAFAHALRLMYQSPLTIGEVSLPLWVSWVGVALGLTMAWLNWSALSQRGKRAILKLLLALVIIDVVALLYSWGAQLAYWGLSGNAFLWFIVLDAFLIVVLWYLLKKKG